MTRGSSLRIPSFTINLATGEPSQITPEIGFDVYPLWLSAAINQARVSEAAAMQLDKKWDGNGGDEISNLVEQELAAAMGCIVACAAAIDAFYGSVRDRCKRPVNPITNTQRRRRARERNILSTFQQRFGLRNEVVNGISQSMRDIFRFRHLALHAHARPEQPVRHPRLQVGMSRKHVIFRAENAAIATTYALNVIAWLTTRPNQRYPELREHCGYARGWLQHLVDDWELDHAPLDLPHPLIEKTK